MKVKKSGMPIIALLDEVSRGIVTAQVSVIKHNFSETIARIKSKVLLCLTKS